MGVCAFQGRKILLTLQMRNLRLREGKSLAQGHRNHLWQAQFPTHSERGRKMPFSGQGGHITHSAHSEAWLACTQSGVKYTGGSVCSFNLRVSLLSQVGT